MDAFPDQPAGESYTDEDPAAEFLARADANLASLEGGEAAPDVGLGGDFETVNGFAGTEEEEQNGDLETADDFTSAEVEDGGSQNGDLYAAVAAESTMDSEPEKIKVWREEQKKRIEQKDEAEAKAQDESKASAAKELADWYKHYEEQLAATKKSNLETEAEYVKHRDAPSAGAEWERISGLVDFNAKSSTNKTKDMARMRQVLLGLKSAKAGGE